MNPLRHIAIEGPIGAGKTSLARRLAERLGADLLLEQPEENPFLTRFYQDMARYALPAQLFFLFQRARQLEPLAQPVAAAVGVALRGADGHSGGGGDLLAVALQHARQAWIRGDRDRDAVGDVEPAVLAPPLDEVDQLAGEALVLEVLVELRVDGDGQAALVGDRIVGAARDGDAVRLTVLLAPPLDAYGVTPRWGLDDAAPDPSPTVADALAAVGLPEMPRGRVRAVGSAERHPFEEGEATRVFMERFERLLVECDEWRRRALAAEDRLTGAERQLRTVERRAEASQNRLDAATEKLRAWGELTRRMQQLVKQADALSRSRPSRPREAQPTGASVEPEGPIEQEVATAS